MRSHSASKASNTAPSTVTVGIAWSAVLAWILLVWWLGSGEFSAATTSRYLEPFLRWLLPDLPYADRLVLLGAIRKLAHPIVYGVLAALAFVAARVSRFEPPWRAAAIAFCLAVAVASLDEARQAMLPSRTGAIADVGLDALGAAAALVAAMWIHSRRPSPQLEGA